MGVRFCHWEEMLKSCLNSLAKTGGEVVEDEMRIDLRHCLQFLVDIVSQHNILKAKVESWPNRQVAKDESIGLATMLMQ